MILSEEKREILANDAYSLFKQVEQLISKHQLEESLQKIQVLMNDFEIIEDYTYLMKCHLLSAICHYNLGNEKTAFELTNQYEELCKKYKVPLDKSEYYPLLGLQYMYKEEYNKAIHYFEEGAKCALKAQSYRRFISLKKHVGHVASMTKQYEVGLCALKEAIQYLSFIDAEDINQVETYLVEVSLYLSMGQFDAAKERLDYVSSHPVLTTKETTHALYLEYYAQYYYKIEQFNEAYECAEKSLTLLEGKNQHVTEQDIFELLVNICKNLGDVNKLTSVYDRYIQCLKESKDRSFQNELSKRDLEDMKKLTEIDNLTGVYNRKYLLEKASEWMNLAPMNNESIICSVFDVDHFKQINDSYGHLVGDDILKELSSYCNAMLEEINTDIFLARYGGDEFVLVNRAVDVDQAIQKIIELYEKLNQFVIESEMGTFSLSISMGVSYTSRGEYKEFNELFKEADEALYLSKQKGRKLLSMYDKKSPTC